MQFVYFCMKIKETERGRHPWKWNGIIGIFWNYVSHLTLAFELSGNVFDTYEHSKCNRLKKYFKSHGFLSDKMIFHIVKKRFNRNYKHLIPKNKYLIQDQDKKTIRNSWVNLFNFRKYLSLKSWIYTWQYKKLFAIFNI